MAIATGAAILGAAVIGGAVSAMGASKGAKAANYAADQQAEAAREANALNERIYTQTREDNALGRSVGNNSLMALNNAFGLGPVSMTGGAPSYGSTPVAGYGGVSMTGAADPRAAYRSDGGDRTSAIGAQGFGGSPSMTAVGGPGVSTYAADTFDPADAGPAAPARGYTGGGSVDWQAYREQNPDVAANVKAEVAAGHYANEDEASAAHYATYGKDENRALPMNPLIGAPGSGQYAGQGTLSPGYNDPTAPGGYMTGSRPDLGAGPQPYVAGQAPGAYQANARTNPGALDVSFERFQKESPDFKFRVQQGNLALDHVAAAGGGRMSGARIKAAERYNQDLAGQAYSEWRGYTTGQSNLDRARGDAIYESDRGFGYGQSRDARTDFETDRGFGYGQARDARGDFVQDRSRSDGLFADDRSRLDNRYDTRNASLMTLAGFGTQANNANQNAAQTFAQSTNNANMTAANARGDARIAGANAFNGAANNIMTTGAYLAGNYLSGGFGGSTPSLPKTYNI